MSYSSYMDESIDTPGPVTVFGQRLRAHSTESQWRRNVASAREKTRLVRAFQEMQESGFAKRKALLAVAPDVPRPTFQGWMRCVDNREGPLWERLLDGRLPPQVQRIPDSVRSFVVGLRIAQPEIPCSAVLCLVAARFGKDGDISERTLRRIWSEEGIPSASLPVPEVVTTSFAGGGMVLLGVADLDTGLMLELAKNIQASGRQTAQEQDKGGIEHETAGVRDERGRLTSAYNHDSREGVAEGDSDWRLSTDKSKRKTRDLGTLSILKTSPEALGGKLAAIGASHLITEQRGFDGLTAPLGSALELLCGVSYMPSTLDKCLSELAVVDAETEIWYTYGERAAGLIRRWTAGETGRTWLQVVVYVDATHDPYWTDKFAESGPVSRTGRVQPCLSRLTVTGGPGIPLVMETYPGGMPLRNEVLRLLERVEHVVGESQIGRLVVMDAEMATAQLLDSFKERHFITVYKGKVDSFTPTGDWQPFRDKDQLREGHVLIRGEGFPDGLRFRAVEMKRANSRRLRSTIFATNMTPDDMGTIDVARAYLSRWPHEEQGFRERRDGLGANHSCGYGGEYIQHFALDTKIAKALRTATHAKERVRIAEGAIAKAETLLPTPAVGKGGAKTKITPDEGTLNLVKVAQRERLEAARAVVKAEAQLQKLTTTSQVIYRRDTTRENIATAASLAVLLLIEYVLREYFAGLRINLRTFIGQFLLVPVTIRTTAKQVTYQFHANLRNPKRTEQLREACKVITDKCLRRSGKDLAFEVIGLPDRTSAGGGRNGLTAP